LAAHGLPADPVVFEAPDGTRLPAIADLNTGAPVLFVACTAALEALARATVDIDDAVRAIIGDDGVPDYLPDLPA
jgi:hypothetical protein